MTKTDPHALCMSDERAIRSNAGVVEHKEIFVSLYFE